MYMISNKKELVKTVEIVNNYLQQIQDYLGEDNSNIGKIKLPKGYIRNIKYHKNRLTFITNEIVRNNLANAFVQTDVYLWLINRISLYGIAREMTIKFAITLVGSIAETLAVTGTENLIGKKHSFYERCNRMVKLEIISEILRDRLHRLWEMRSGIHIYDISFIEYKKYKLSDYNRAVVTCKKLRRALELFHEKSKSISKS
jgi:hypothetical protein